MPETFFNVQQKVRPRLKIYAEDDFLDFGKYKGMTIKEVIDDDPEYLVWCLDNVNFFDVSENVLQLIENAQIENDFREAMYDYLDDDPWREWENF